MAISVFDIFKVGIGPSSSHTVGPMKAARAFAMSASDVGAARYRVTLHGSLAWTGKGHGTDAAILLGLAGHEPESIDPDAIDDILAAIRSQGRVDIDFDYERELERHTNGMVFAALGNDGNVLQQETYYSLGGGFIARGDEVEPAGQDIVARLPYTTSKSLLETAATERMAIAELVMHNEMAWRSEAAIREGLDAIWTAMQACMDRGLRTEGVLPGKMAVARRASKLYRSLSGRGEPQAPDAMEWVNAWAIAVNEENAAGGRVVTSPTNGAAGIIPAVIRYYATFVPKASDDGVRRFLLTAGAIGILYKVNASISGAEMGCQGEVGVACSMAAGGLAATLGGSNDHVEEAAEIGMEHNLGLTCDPIGGLVQIPCIERNAMGAVKAINAARLAMHGDGTHKVTLDQVIATMRQTGLDMSARYKETSQGGLAVNVPEC
ncbi:MAG: L-serine ammonia-lyase [Gammaproteobacteria bacterium]|nr:L-serine ammonia-lyase [Gammaproteobacteria bacterium]NNF48539.1 L-serine ammonia-lyase [Woeseiaceae bacterium]MBT8095181.1 L-serine ammonia-lyase [Gammaproteobacteria bacterium]MBT8105339.1 L-serine ammonia-lyase [Gammaproteobacteria bacterium]NNK25353.1 L-serine ammonia-lyase [Woeseiaceae bacterium]